MLPRYLLSKPTPKEFQVDQFEASEFVPLNGYHLLISNLQSSGTINNQREFALQQSLRIKQLTLQDIIYMSFKPNL